MMEPIIKWVGGKRWLAPKLAKRIHNHLNKPDGEYYEPFFGSGAVFFKVLPKYARIADSLEALTFTMSAIKKDSMSVWNYLKAVTNESNSAEHYKLRRYRFNTLLSKGTYTPEFAALFIYLNKTGFNGLWRQNKEGEFNVPYGDYKQIKLPTFADLLNVSKALQNTIIHTISSPQETINLIHQAKSGDVIFSDPPYLDTYQGYDGIFEASPDFHEELAVTLWQAVRKGVTIFATNNDCPEIRKWYGAFAEIETYNRSQSVAGTVEGRKRWNQILAVGIP
jgi:DNA adenine methylase